MTIRYFMVVMKAMDFQSVVGLVLFLYFFDTLELASFQ